MKKLVLIFSVLGILSCKKEDVMPVQEMSVQVNGQEVQNIIPSLRFSGGEYKISGSTQDELVQLEIDLGEEIQSKILHPNAIEGDLDPVFYKSGLTTYYLSGSSTFLVTIQESEGYYNGSFSGSLKSQSNNLIELSGSFSNL